MGYTHYWKSKGFTAEQWNRFTKAANRLIELAPGKVQREGDDPSPPEIDEAFVIFNGIGDDAHETFIVGIQPEKFAFCKTAYKPYDEIVVACLIAAAHVNPGFSWSSDGDREEHAAGEALAAKLEIPYTTGHEEAAS